MFLMREKEIARHTHGGLFLSLHNGSKKKVSYCYEDWVEAMTLHLTRERK